MFDWSTPPLYDSSNSNIKIVYKSIEHFLQNPSDFYSDVVFDNLYCLWIVFINSFFQVPSQKIVRGGGGWDLGNRVARGYRFNARWVCPLGSTAWGIQVLEHHSVHINASLPSQCRNKLSSHHLDVLLCIDGHTIPIIIFKNVRPKDPPLPIAHYTVTFSWLNGRWVCLWGCWDAQNLMFCLLTCSLKWKWASSLNKMKPSSPGLFSILSLRVWQNSLLSSFLASVCFWRIFTLYGNNFKSLWMILCTVVLKMPTSWDSRRVDYRGDCSRCFLSAWTLARVLTATYHPLWPLLSFPTLLVFLNFSTIFVIVFLHGVSQEITCET